MATEQRNRTAASAKFESFVEQQLAQVKKRLRALDVGAATLFLLAITLGYAVVMAVFDLLVRGSSEAWVTPVRLGTFGLFLAGLGFGGYLLVSRMLRRINPYYCAQELEQTLPDAKNSVINWLDLKNEHLAPAIRSSLGIRAAKDLEHADADKVVDPKQTWLLGGVAGVLFAALIVVFAISPGQFGSLLARAFLPFRDINLANRVTIALIRPTGDISVPRNTRVEFVAEISGRFPKVNHPQAPTLWYRYGPADAFVALPLEEDPLSQWVAVLAADQVQNGFWYKLSAGDAETPVYQVAVRSQPVATKFEITYHYRPYRTMAPDTVVFPNEHAVFPEVSGHRGTEVALIVRTNQPVREGRLQLKFGATIKEVLGQRLPDDPQAFRCKFGLEQTGQFLVLFKTQSEESNSDRDPYRIEVLDDLPPGVVLSKPGQDVKLPANGALSLEGHAMDDFGVKGLALRLRVLEGEQKPNLAAQPYRPAKSFKFETGAYPTRIDYLDVLALDQLKTEQGQAFPLSAGMVLEYWLEATDNADYPSATGNLGRSLAYKINILEPQKDDKKRQDERKQANDQQKKHEKQQDQQHKKENDQKKQDAANAGSNKSPEERQADNLKNKLDDIKNKLKEELDREEQQKNQGTSKGNEPPKSDNKSNEGEKPEAKPKDSQAGKDPHQAGAKKDDGAKSDGPKSAEAKGPGDKQPPQTPDQKQASEPKGPGNEKPPSAAKGKDDDNKTGSQPNPQPENAKSGPKDDPKEQPGQGKDEGKQGGMDKSAQAKENGPKEDNMKQGPEAKGPQGNKNSPQPTAKNDTKNPKNQPAGQKGDSKPGTNEELAKEKGQGNSKPDATASKNPPGADGTRKPAQAKGNEEPVRKAENKEDGGSGQDLKQGPPAQAKGQPMNPNGQPQGNTKETPADQAKESATAKNEHGQGPPREPTLKDLERLKDQLKNNDPKAVDSAKELQRNLPETKDSQLRKNAEELLKEAAKLEESLAKNQEPMPGVTPKPGGNEPGANPKDNTGDPKTTQADVKDPNLKGANGNPEKNKPGPQSTTGPKPAGSGPGGQGPDDKTNPSAANQQFADQVANMQLQDLKQRVTPEMRKLAGVSDEEWQQFLKNAQAYEDLRAKLQNQPKGEPNQKRGSTSKLAGVGPRQVGASPGALNPTTVGATNPPPELREAQRLFTQKKQ